MGNWIRQSSAIQAIMKNIINNLTGRKVFGKDETEYFEEIISNISVDRDYTFVFNIGHQPLGDVPKNSIVFSTADEQHAQPISDHLRDEVVLIFKNYFPADPVCDSRVYPMPLGYLMGFSGNSDIPILNREVDYSFIGTFNNSGREKMCQQLQARKNDGRKKFCAITQGWGQGLNMNEYGSLMSNTKIALCPSGYISKESYRIFEAAKCGCVLLVDDLPLHLWYYDGFPGIVIKDWSDLSVIEELLNDPLRMQDISQKTIEWYNSKISPVAVAKYIQDKIERLNHA